MWPDTRIPVAVEQPNHGMPGRLRSLLPRVLALLVGAGAPAAMLTQADAAPTFNKACKEWADEPLTAQSLKRCYYIDVVVANQGDLPNLGKGEFNQLLTNRGKNRFSVHRLPPGPTGIVFDPVTGEIKYKKGSPTTTAAVALADVDGDGDLDVFVANHGFLNPDLFDVRAGESNVLLINQGNGTFKARALDKDQQIRNNTHVAAGDLDNDGDIDFLVTSDGNPVRMYKNDGKGNFTVTDVTPGVPGVDHLGNPVTYAATGPDTGGPRRSLHVALGDLDGDGDLDALVAYDGDRDQFLRNNGNGTFTVTDIEPVYLDTEAVAIADLDGNGTLDAIFVFDGDGAVVAWNDGNGNFTLEPIAGTEGSHSKDIVIGDFDRDGYFDAIVVNTSLADGVTEEFSLLLRNNRNGGFDVSTVGPPLVTVARVVKGPKGGRATRGEAVVAADFDGDGDLDVLIGNVTIRGVDSPERNYMLRNDGLDRAGNIIFKAVTVAGGPRVTDGLAAGDVDGSGFAPPVKDGLPNINLDGLLPKMYPKK